jgi:hypothetical protein
MSLSTALTALTSLTVSGVTLYAFGTSPDLIPATVLPCMVARIDDVFNDALVSATIAGEGGIASIPVMHTLFTNTMGVGRSEARDANTPALIDAYFAALASDLTLGGALARPLSIVWLQTGGIEWGNSLYYGVRFRHLWQFEISA